MRIDTLPLPGTAKGHAPRFVLVALLHVMLIWGLMSGLASQLKRSEPQAPIALRLIPDENPPPVAPDHFTLANRYRAPDPLAPTVPAFSVDPPPAAEHAAPVAPARAVATASAATGAAPGLVAGALAQAASAFGGCSNARDIGAEIEYPAKARRLGLTSGTAEVTFSVAADGRISILGVQSSNRAFEASALEATSRLHCPAGHYVLPLSFALAD